MGKMNQKLIWGMAELQQLFQSDTDKEDPHTKSRYQQLLYFLNQGHVVYEKVEGAGHDSETADKRFSPFLADDQTIVKAETLTIEGLFTYLEQGFKRVVFQKVQTLHVLCATTTYSTYLVQQRAYLQREQQLFSMVARPILVEETRRPVLNPSMEIGEYIEFKWHGAVVRGVVEGEDIVDLEPHVRRAKKRLEFMKKQQIRQNPQLQKGHETQVEVLKESESILTEPNIVIRRFLPFKNSLERGTYKLYIIKPEHLLHIHKALDRETLYENIVARIPSFLQNGPAIQVNNRLRGSACYLLPKHQISLNLFIMKEVAAREFIEHGTPIEDTMYMILAHELGHADPESLKLFDTRFKLLLLQLYLLEKLMPSDEEPITNKWALFLQKKHCVLAEKCFEYILESERNAFKHGLKYVAPHLHYVFQRLNAEQYQGQKSGLMDELYEQWASYYSSVKQLNKLRNEKKSQK